MIRARRFVFTSLFLDFPTRFPRSFDDYAAYPQQQSSDKAFALTVILILHPILWGTRLADFTPKDCTLTTVEISSDIQGLRTNAQIYNRGIKMKRR